METILLYLIDHFPDLLDVTFTASIVILFVICVRQFLKPAPKIFAYALWAIVLLRLLVPISIESPMSFVPEPMEFSSMVDVNEVLPVLEFESPADRVSNQLIRENTPSGEPFVQTSRSLDAEAYLTFLWLAGMAFMLLRSIVSYWKLRKRVRVAVPFRRGIYIADDIDTPFVMGIFRPVIYLPGTLADNERKYIIAHERHHIRRGDHIFKALGFLALTIHWFNPLVWVAFVLAGRDMEMSCDEAVIRKLGEDVRAEYSASLLNLATGQQLFRGTPLAFGEADPTGRVRNLAKWKKPAFWLILVCVVLCVVLAVCLLTNPERELLEEIETIETVPPETEAAEWNDWGVSIQPDRVSRTGATALFIYDGNVPGEEGAELTYGDFLSLDRLVDGAWIPCDELAGFDYFVGDSSYPVVDGYGMVHEWPNRFGELADGHYRLGKQVTLVRVDGTQESRMVYGEFTLPDSVHTGPIPLEELPEKYGAEQAMIDGCLVCPDGIARDNMEQFREFADACNRGEAGFFRVMYYYYGDDPHYIAYDIHYDGSNYTVNVMESGDGRISVYEYPYLKHFTGTKEREEYPYDAYEYYSFVGDADITWQEIFDGQYEGRFMPIFLNHIYYPKTPQLPANPMEATLELNGDPLVTTKDFDRLEKIWILFQDAEYLGYEPKTHSIGLGLNLILESQSGETMTIELDPDSDICRINGEYVFYGAVDEPDYIEKLWYYLGIPSWPDSVYEKYPNAYRPYVN